MLQKLQEKELQEKEASTMPFQESAPCWKVDGTAQTRSEFIESA
jgi:hypothetical protein